MGSTRREFEYDVEGYVRRSSLKCLYTNVCLTMMLRVVLNDVLDFDRLDSGRFSTVKMPYNFVRRFLSAYVHKWEVLIFGFVSAPWIPSSSSLTVWAGTFS